MFNGAKRVYNKICRMENYKKLLNLAIDAGRRRDYRSSIKYLNKIITKTDTIPEAFLYMGRCCHCLKDYYTAIYYFLFFLSFRKNSAAGNFFTGRAYICCGLPQNALPYLEKAASLAPQNPMILSFLGSVYLKTKKTDKAVTTLEKAVSIAPENRQIYTGYLNALLTKGFNEFNRENFEDTRQIFEFLLKIHGRSLPLHVYLGFIYREKGDYENALKHYDAAISEKPNDTTLLIQHLSVLKALGKNDEYIEELARLCMLRPEYENISFTSEEKNRVLAVEMFRKKDYMKALFFAVKTLRADPDDMEMHLLIGDAYMQLGDLKKAENHFKRVSGRNKTSKEARYGLVMVYWLTGDFKKALTQANSLIKLEGKKGIGTYYKALALSKLNFPVEKTIPAIHEAIKIFPPDQHLFISLGEEYLKAKRADLSEGWYKRAMKLSPKNRKIYTGLLKTYHALEENENITDTFVNYLSLFPNDMRIRGYFIHHLYKNGMYDEAAKEIIKEISSKRNDLKLLRLLGFCMRKKGDFDKSLIIFRQLLKLNPHDISALKNYAVAVEKAESPEKAGLFLEKAVSRFEEKAEILFLAGVIYKRNGFTDMAADCFKNVISIDKKYTKAYENLIKIYEKLNSAELAEKYRREMGLFSTEK